MTREQDKTSSQTHSLTLQYVDDSILEAGGASGGSTNEVDDFMDSFYLDGVDTPTESNEINTPSGLNSNADVYDLYTYTVASTPASESYQSASACSSGACGHSFNKEDFEYQLGLAVARYDSKPRRWTCYNEQDDGPSLDDSDALIRGWEAEQDVTAETLSRSPQLEQRTEKYGAEIAIRTFTPVA